MCVCGGGTEDLCEASSPIGEFFLFLFLSSCRDQAYVFDLI
jgi:hypothetical protein